MLESRPASLHAHLEELNFSIVAQKRALASSERERIQVLGQLNRYYDPLTRLPPEITAEIFTHCLHTSDDVCNRMTTAPILFLRVCRSWNKLARKIPALWSSLSIIRYRQASLDRYSHHVCCWIDRARARPLSLTFVGSAGEEIGAIISGCAGHLHKLHLAATESAYSTAFSRGKRYPTLQFLTIRGAPSSEYHFETVSALRIFRSSPSLLECTLRDPARTVRVRAGTHVVHTSLRAFELEQGGGILKFLTFPALERLGISFGSQDSDAVLELIPFFARSGSHLASLTLDPGNIRWERQTTEAFLRILPALTHLRLNESHFLAEDVIAILAGSESEPPSEIFLPNLTHLTVVSHSHVDGVWYTRLGSMLSGRGAPTGGAAKLQSFRLEWRVNYAGPMPEEDVWDTLESLMAGGMEIYISEGETSDREVEL